MAYWNSSQNLLSIWCITRPNRKTFLGVDLDPCWPWSLKRSFFKVIQFYRSIAHIEGISKAHQTVKLIYEILTISRSNSGVKVTKQAKKRDFYLFGLQIWPWKNQFRIRGHIVTRAIDNWAIFEICVKNVDLFFQGQTWCPKSQMYTFLPFLTFSTPDLTLKK